LKLQLLQLQPESECSSIISRKKFLVCFLPSVLPSFGAIVLHLQAKALVSGWLLRKLDRKLQARAYRS